MNKEQIEEAKRFMSQYKTDNRNGIISYNSIAELIIEYLESKREGIERKAYEAGHKNTFCSEYTGWDFELKLTYDEWKESQNQE